MTVQRKMVLAKFLIGAAAACGALAVPPLARAAETGDAAKLLVVDCLLPGQVRKLGTSVTYLTARRPVKTAAGECELRGGEYVASDRSNYASALKIWIPGARDGDKIAQTYVGEIFEKGVGTAPDYAAAAAWYQKAADQGYARAQINLGFLYEKGLGVPKDPLAALNWYRKASGLPDAIALDDGNPNAGTIAGTTAGASVNATASADAARQQKELDALRTELAQTQKQLDNARQELERQKQRSQSEVNRLKDQQRKAADAGNVGEASKLAATLAQREQELAARSQDVALLEQQMSGFRTQLASLQTESAELREQLGRAREQLSGSQKELAARRTELADTKRRLELTRTDLAKQKQDATAAAQAETKRLQTQLAQRERDLKAQTDELARAEQKAQRYRDDLAGLETKAAQKPATSAPAAAPVPPSTPVATAGAPPSIQVIDPPIVLTRATPSIEVRGGVATRDIVGRVIAWGGLLSFTVNDQAAEKSVDANGLFRVAIPLTGKPTPVSIVAVDQQGKRGSVTFTLVPDGTRTASSAPPAPPKIAPLNFGSFYALVIGNENYKHLTQLKTAVNDATAISEVLTTKYGFKTTTLKNATRYQILSELNKLRAQLTENDNLLIYYAGHGELDKTNQRGYWLPVDAEQDSDANWISSIAITDILNAMSVKHVLVVADSCYSGALTRSSIGQLDAGRSDEERINWLKAISKQRSRVVLTSGGLQPVLDGGGGKHSVFARSFLEVLNVNVEVIEARRVYQELSARVLNEALRYRIEQVPQYAPMQFAGHESGDFLFVRRAH